MGLLEEKKRVLIIPSYVGLGDLALARHIIGLVSRDFHVTLALWETNKDTPFAEKILCDKIVLPSQARSDAEGLHKIIDKIKGSDPDVILVLNCLCRIPAIATGIPVVHVTHEFYPEMLDASYKALKAEYGDEGIEVLPYLKERFKDIKRGDTSYLRPLERSGRMSPAPQHVLSHLLCEHVIVQSIFRLGPYGPVARGRKALFGDAPNAEMIFTDPAIPTEIVKYRRHPEKGRELASKYFGEDLTGKKLVVVSMGGSADFSPLFAVAIMMYLTDAISKAKDPDLRVILVGEAVEVERGSFSKITTGMIKNHEDMVRLVGKVSYEEHLSLLSAADLVLTHPGYNTLLEATGMYRPLVILFDICPTSERALNIKNANEGALCLKGDENGYWLVIVPYSSKIPRIDKNDAIDFLVGVFKDLDGEDCPRFEELRGEQKKAIVRHRKAFGTTLVRVLRAAAGSNPTVEEE